MSFEEELPVLHLDMHDNDMQYDVSSFTLFSHTYYAHSIRKLDWTITSIPFGKRQMGLYLL